MDPRYVIQNVSADVEVDTPGVDDYPNASAGLTKRLKNEAGHLIWLIGEVFEGDVGLFTFPAVDPESAELIFEFANDGRSDTSVFTLIPGTNQFRFIDPPDFEQPRDQLVLNNADPNDIYSYAADNIYYLHVLMRGWKEEDPFLQYGTHYAVIVKNVAEDSDSQVEVPKVGGNTSTYSLSNNSYSVNEGSVAS